MSGTIQQTKQMVEAVYENGVFRPLAPLEEPIAEGQNVHIVVERPLSPKEMTKLAASVYEGLSKEEIDEIEKVILDRSFLATEKRSDICPSSPRYQYCIRV